MKGAYGKPSKLLAWNTARKPKNGRTEPKESLLHK